MRSLILILVMVGFAVTSSEAQTLPPPQSAPATPSAAPHRVHGTIVSFAGGVLTVQPDTGSTIGVGVLPTTVILYNEPRKVADIHSGDFVASAAILGSDGKLHAQEMRVFPEQLRGMGEGQYPMGDPPTNRSMTNATVAQVTTVLNGGTLQLSYHGAGAPGDPGCTGHAASGGNGCVGTTQIVVAPGVPVFAYVVGDASSFVAGAAVSMVVATGPEGTPVTPRLLVEHNGVKPMM